MKNPDTRPQEVLLPNDGVQEVNDLEDSLCLHPSDADEAMGILVGTKPVPLPRLQA